MAKMVGTPSVIKLLNKDVVEGIIRKDGPVSRPEIAKKSELSLVTVNKIVDILLQEEKIRTVESEQSSPGRKAQYFVMNESFKYYIGLYYEKGQFNGAIANALGELVYKENFPLIFDLGPESALDCVKSAIYKLKSIYPQQRVAAIGIGVPGVVQDGEVSNIPTIAEWEGVDIAKRLEEQFGINVYLENDVNLAALGMYGKDFKDQIDDMVYLYLDQGMGSGIILRGNLLKGSTNFAGEVGSLAGVAAEGEEELPKGRLQKQVAWCLKRMEQEERGSEVWLRMKTLLCEAVASTMLAIICVLNPEFLVVNCAAIEEEDLEEIKKLLARRIGRENFPEIEMINDMEDLGVQGAVNMCIRESKTVYTLERKRV